MPEFLTIDEVGEILRVSKPTMYRMVESRIIPYYHIGRTLRFDRKDILHYIEKSRVASREEWKALGLRKPLP